jgi:hypothetical protein
MSSRRSPPTFIPEMPSTHPAIKVVVLRTAENGWPRLAIESTTVPSSRYPV